MAQEQLDVTGIGNAIVDVIAQASDAFLEENGLTKGAMRLIDAGEATALYEKMGSGLEMSGGSAGNTMAGLAMLGANAAFVGKVAEDQLGRVFSHDIKAVGAHFDTEALKDGAPTARCLILVTPDAQRTMNTYLGACVELGPDDIDLETVARSKVTYMEGYLWDPPKAKEAFLKAAKIAHEADRKVSISLSDSFCVDRHRASFMELVREHIDILFANESEICSLFETDSFDTAAAQVKEHCETIALTRSEKGSIVLHQGQAHEVPAAPVEKVVDTTGAGDLYAAGFLYGYTHGFNPSEWGQMGSLAAAEVISHFGARPETDLKKLFAEQIVRFST